MHNPPSRGDHPIQELEAALVRWRALLLIGDLQRRAYLEQLQQEPPGEGERLYRQFALRPDGRREPAAPRPRSRARIPRSP